MFIVTQLTQILQKGGYQVVDYAVDGKQAVEKFSALANSIDVVTLDITLPGQDGVAVLQQLKSIKPGVIVVIVSAIGKQDLVLETRRLGADGYIIKPLSREKVLDRIAALCKTV
jgi:two-component system, chemotaxis family, chemotaxis protein CheY